MAASLGFCLWCLYLKYEVAGKGRAGKGSIWNKLTGLKSSFAFSPSSWYSGGGEDYYTALEFFVEGGWSQKGYKYQQPHSRLAAENNWHTVVLLKGTEQGSSLKYFHRGSSSSLQKCIISQTPASTTVGKFHMPGKVTRFKTSNRLNQLQ